MRTKIDFLSLLGLLLICSVFFSILFFDNDPIMFYNPHAIIIVLVGSFGAVFLEVNAVTIFSAIRSIRYVFVPYDYSEKSLLSDLGIWANISRKEGLLALEKKITIEDDLCRRWVQLVLLGISWQELRKILHNEIDEISKKDEAVVNFYGSLGGYAPTMGLVGAIVGLIDVLTKLEDPNLIGFGIASAFIATLYGIVSANLLFLPISGKLDSYYRVKHEYYRKALEGIIFIARGHSAARIQITLGDKDDG